MISVVLTGWLAVRSVGRSFGVSGRARSGMSMLGLSASASAAGGLVMTPERAAAWDACKTPAEQARWCLAGMMWGGSKGDLDLPPVPLIDPAERLPADGA